MIDLHCHILPGIDDGPATSEESLAMVRAAAAAGARTLVATPHVSMRYPNRAAHIAQLVDDLRERVRAEQIDVEICAGAEIAIARVGDLQPEELDRLTLGGGRWLLIEPPFVSTAHGIEPIVADLQRRDYRVVLAHPERCVAFQRDPAMIESMVSAGALTSVTAGSLTGRFGRDVREFTLRLAQQGLVHNVSSDAHDVLRRPPGALSDIEQAGLGPLSRWLTHEVPAAMLDDEVIPRRPVVELSLPPARSGRWRWPLNAAAFRPLRRA